MLIARDKKIDQLVPVAQQIASGVAGGQTLEQAGPAHGATVATTPMFTRMSTVPGVGQLNEAIGAAFGLPVGAVSAPIKTSGGVFVIRVDKRVPAARAEFEKQLPTLRTQTVEGLREQRVRDYLEGLRKTAKIDDRRKEVESSARRAGA